VHQKTKPKLILDGNRMKTVLLLATVILLACAGSASAQVTIYEDSFTGTGSLNASTPTIDTGGNGGTAGATFIADGTWQTNGSSASANTAGASNAFLPFTPVAGQDYTLSATLSASGLDWTTLGFTQYDSTNSFFYNTPNPTPSPWILLGTGSSPAVNVYSSGLTQAGSVSSGLSQGDTYTITLDTSATSAWTFAVTASGPGITGTLTILPTTTFASNPTINYVGFGAIVDNATVSNFTLIDTSAVSTTPTTYTLVTTAGSTLLHQGATTTLHTTLTNTGTGTADSIDYSGVGATASSGSVSGSTISGNVANGGGTTSNTGQTYTATTAGADTISSAGTLTNHTIGGAPTGTPTGTTINVYSGQGVWNTNGGGSWGTVSATPANWTANGGTPGLDGDFTNTDSATFGNALTSGTANVLLGGANPNLNAITFANTNGASYNIEGTNGGSTGTITLNGAGSSAATVTDTAGMHSVSAPVVLGANGANVNVSSGQQVSFLEQISGTSALATITGTGTTILSNATGNTYSGGTTVGAGKLFADGGVAGTSSATGTGTVSVSSGATLGGSGVIRPTIASAGLTLASGSTLYSGDIPTGTAAGNGLTLDNTVSHGTILDASLGNATLVFNLGTGTTGLTGSTVGQQPLDFANPNVGSSFIKVLDNGGPSSVGELKFAAGDTIQINDLTGGSLQLNQGIPYLLIQAGSNADYAGLITSGGTLGDVTQNGWVENLHISYTGNYVGMRLYLFDGDLEVVPEPGTWALMIGGLALLAFWRHRSSRASEQV
jgi:hypothetical protein